MLGKGEVEGCHGVGCRLRCNSTLEKRGLRVANHCRFVSPLNERYALQEAGKLSLISAPARGQASCMAGIVHVLSMQPHH